MELPPGFYLEHTTTHTLLQQHRIDPTRHVHEQMKTQHSNGMLQDGAASTVSISRLPCSTPVQVTDPSLRKPSEMKVQK